MIDEGDGGNSMDCQNSGDLFTSGGKQIPPKMTNAVASPAEVATGEPRPEKCPNCESIWPHIRLDNLCTNSWHAPAESPKGSVDQTAQAQISATEACSDCGEFGCADADVIPICGQHTVEFYRGTDCFICNTRRDNQKQDICPRCMGTGIYNFGPCSICNATGKLSEIEGCGGSVEQTAREFFKKWALAKFGEYKERTEPPDWCIAFAEAYASSRESLRVKELREGRDSWRRVAEKLETEKRELREGMTVIMENALEWFDRGINNGTVEWRNGLQSIHARAEAALRNASSSEGEKNG